MNERTLRTLEYGKILERIAAFASTEKAKSDILAIRPLNDIEAARALLSLIHI